MDSEPPKISYAHSYFFWEEGQIDLIRFSVIKKKTHNQTTTTTQGILMGIRELTFWPNGSTGIPPHM